MMRTDQIVLTGTLVAAALVLSGAPAEAQRGERKPVILKVTDGNNQETKRAPQGGVINLVGRNMHRCPSPPKDTDPKELQPCSSSSTGKCLPSSCRKTDLTVKVAGANAFVVASTFDFVTLIIPQSTSPNKRVRVEVSIKNRGSAYTSIEVVDHKKWTIGKTEAGTESGSLSGTNRLDDEQRILQSFKITKFQQVPTSAGDTFVVEGIATSVPDKLTVQVELRYEGQTIPNGMRHIAIMEEKFKTTFGPYNKKLLHGNYSLELLFEMGKQSKRKTRKWKKKLSDKQIEVYSRVQRRELTPVGTGPGGTCTKEDRARQKSKVKGHYLTFCKQVLRLRDDLRGAVADAGRSFFKEGRGYNEDNYKRWLQQMGFAEDGTAAQKIIDNPKYGKASGHFQARTFKSFADKLLEGLTALHKKHREFNDQYIAPIDERADTMGDWLISIVLLRFQEWSKDLYRHSGLEYPPEFGQVPISPVPAPKLSRKFFDAKRRELMHRAGLGAEVAREKQAK